MFKEGTWNFHENGMLVVVTGQRIKRAEREQEASNCGRKEKQGSLENSQKKLYLFLHYNWFISCFFYFRSAKGGTQRWIVL